MSDPFAEAAAFGDADPFAGDASFEAAAAAATVDPVESGTDQPVSEVQPVKFAAFDSAFQFDSKFEAPLAVAADPAQIEEPFPDFKAADLSGTGFALDFGGVASGSTSPQGPLSPRSRISMPSGTSASVLSPRLAPKPDPTSLAGAPSLNDDGSLMAELSARLARGREAQDQATRLEGIAQGLNVQVAALKLSENQLMRKLLAMEVQFETERAAMKNAQSEAVAAEAAKKELESQLAVALTSVQPLKSKVSDLESALKHRDKLLEDAHNDIDYWKRMHDRLAVYAQKSYDQLIYVEKTEEELRSVGMIIPVDVTRRFPAVKPPQPDARHEPQMLAVQKRVGDGERPSHA
jgi:hypothetical protein